MKERGLTRAIEDYNKGRGIERTSIHAFRHWYAKKSVLNGVNIVQLQHLLGHSNLEILKHYVEMLTQDLNYKDIAQNPLESIKLETSKGKNINMKRKQMSNMKVNINRDNIVNDYATRDILGVNIEEFGEI